MSAHIKRAIAAMEAARPASGYRPETDAEWKAALRASEELGYAIYREAGMTDKKARELARLLHSGPAGMKLLRASFERNKNG